MRADPAPLPDTMRALRFTQFGTPAEALTTTQVPLPTLTPGESLVHVHAAGINPSESTGGGEAYTNSGDLALLIGRDSTPLAEVVADAG